MKNTKTASNIAFLFSIISLPLAFSLSCLIGEVEVFGTAGIVRYSWIMYLFIPISVISFACGIAKRRIGEKYKKHIIVSCVTSLLLIIFGSYGFVFGSAVDYSAESINNIEEKAVVDLPDDIKVATLKYEEHDLSYVKVSGATKTDFEKMLSTNGEWITNLSPSVKGTIPYTIQAQLSNYDYYRFFNCTTTALNISPTEPGEYNCVLIAYDVELGRLMILDYCWGQ